MSGLGARVKHGFGGVFRFSGRDDRATFWLYAGCLYLIVNVAFAAVMFPALAVMFLRVGRAAAADGRAGDISDVRTVLTGVAVAVAGLGAIFGFLIAAAVARRLRDSGRSPLWGWLPVPFYGFSAVEMPLIFASVGGGGEPPLFVPVFLSNMIYNVAMVGLIVLLCMSSRPSPTAWAHPPA